MDDSSIYFSHYSKGLLIEAVKLIFQRSLETEEQPDLKSYRLVMTLLDKPDVGGAILEEIMIDVLRAMYHSSNNRYTESSEIGQTQHQPIVQDTAPDQELIKSANLLFGTLESAFIWEFCGGAFDKASCQRFRISDTEVDAVNFVGSQDTTVIEMCALVDFLLDIVSIETYVETASEHLPNLFKSIVSVLNDKVQDLTTLEVTKALQLAKKLLSKVQPAWNAWDMDPTAVATSTEKSRETEMGREATESLRLGFCVLDFLSIILGFLSREKLTQK